jgi:Protein kinase domain/Inner membrane component of T3SS, cytoplasmic domain
MPDFVEVSMRGAAEAEKRVTVRKGDSIVIGRDSSCQMVIHDDAIAPRQARLICEGNLMRLESLAQTGVLRVDDRPVSSSVLVRSGQPITVGPATISWGFLADEECHTVAATGPTAGPQGSAAETLASELKIERYVDMERQAGVGGMGKVQEVLDKPLGRPVAMKLMLVPESLREQERFIHEARITGQLEHPSIVPVHELNVDHEGRIFYTMKLLRGLTLAEVLKLLSAGNGEASQRYDLPALLIIYQKLCDAIAFAHSRKPTVIHRDLKPENIMVGEYGEVQVMDWGLAKIIGRVEALEAWVDEAKSKVAVITATPSSPELSPPSAPPSPLENDIPFELGLTLEGEIMALPPTCLPNKPAATLKARISGLTSMLSARFFMRSFS